MRSSVVEKLSKIAEHDACWTWTRGHRVSYKNQTFSPHRLSLFLVDPNPSWQHLQVRHLCGNSKCVNPSHLKWGNAYENASDKDVHGTQNKGEKNYNSKLSDADRRIIFESTLTTKELKVMYPQVSLVTLWKIKSGTSATFITMGREEELRQRELRRESTSRNKRMRLSDKAYMGTYVEKLLRKCSSVPCIPNDSSITLHRPCRVYPSVDSLSGYAVCRFGSIHRLVASFIHNDGKRIQKGNVVRHLCRNQKACCEPEHLKIGTHVENGEDVIKAGHGNRRLTDGEVKEIMSLKGTTSSPSIAMRFSVSCPTILNIWNGRSYKHLTNEK